MNEHFHHTSKDGYALRTSTKNLASRHITFRFLNHHLLNMQGLGCLNITCHIVYFGAEKYFYSDIAESGITDPRNTHFHQQKDPQRDGLHGYGYQSNFLVALVQRRHMSIKVFQSSWGSTGCSTNCSSWLQQDIKLLLLTISEGNHRPPVVSHTKIINKERVSTC